MKRLDIEPIREAWRVFRSHNGRMLAGSIAFSSLLSFVPLCLLVVRFAALFIDPSTAHETLINDLSRWVGPEGATTIAELLGRAQSSGTHASVLGAAVLVWGATRLFSVVRRALDTLWGLDAVDDTLKEKAARFLEVRLRSFGLVLSIGAVLVVLAFLHTGVSMARQWANLPILGQIGEVVLSYAVTTMLFAGIYRVLPSKTVSLRDATIGGAITSMLFTTGSVLTGSYIAWQTTRSPFGTATSLVLLLVWVYYSAHAFLFGAAITAARARRMGAL